MKIDTVLCPIDFSSLSDFELRLATEVCETFGARLVLHHNLDAAGLGAQRGEGSPEDAAVADAAAAGERLEQIRARLPGTVEVSTRVSSGPVERSLLDLIAEVGADLVTLGSHGWSSKEHASVSERILAAAPCPILAFQEGRGEHPFRLRAAEGEALKAVVPSDFSRAADAAVDYAFDLLLRATPLKLHLLSVCASDQEVDVTRQRLARRVPADLEGRVECHAAIGTVGDRIAALAADLDAELIVMGEHAPDFLRHYLTHDTAREMLHRSRCPVWYVPTGYRPSAGPQP
jgi:nucleotide-binding universal stress UspA family protein